MLIMQKNVNKDSPLPLYILKFIFLVPLKYYTNVMRRLKTPKSLNYVTFKLVRFKQNLQQLGLWNVLCPAQAEKATRGPGQTRLRHDLCLYVLFLMLNICCQIFKKMSLQLVFFFLDKLKLSLSTILDFWQPFLDLLSVIIKGVILV